MKLLLSLAMLLSFLTACTSPPKFNMRQVDNTISAKSQDTRVKFLILHYTAINQEKSLRVLSQEGVSSHYLVGDDLPTTVYRLVDENRLANHAGVSSWKDYTHINNSSIGIEIVNLGSRETPDGRQYFRFPEYQIDAVLTLVKDIVARHHISPENILGHGEIAPQRKPDPGPLFPWKKLADAGLINWPNPEQLSVKKTEYELNLPDISWFQKKLAEHGYATPQTSVLDQETRNVLTVFQTRYRPSLFDGTPDAESAAILDILTTKIQKQE